MNPNAYIDSLLQLLRTRPVKVLIPGHDASISAIRARRGELERYTVVALPSEAALQVAVDKTRTLALADTLGLATPKRVPVATSADVAGAIGAIGYPAVVKPVSSWVESGGDGVRLSCEVATTADEVRRAVDRVVLAGGQVVLQEWLPGTREAVTVFRADGRIWARFAQKSYREAPPLGGISVLCEGIELSAEIVEPAERLVHAIALDGCSMIEFRRDRNGHPVLMEVNPRICGSVALAIASGINFPQMVYSLATGMPLREVTGYRIGRRLRYLVGELWYLKQVMINQGHPDIPPLGRALSTCLADFVFRPSAFEFDLEDPVPTLVEWKYELTRPFTRRLKSIFAGRRLGEKCKELGSESE
ncbi:MAG TPA: ATP-grasp domain-containing protein [Fimbriiglobus sp.]